MAKDNKKLVEAITSMDVDFAQWYTDVVKKAELIDYSSGKRMYDHSNRQAMRSGRISRKSLTADSKRQAWRMYTCRCLFRRACSRKRRIT